MFTFLFASVSCLIDDVCVQRRNRIHDVVELAITHVSVDLCVIFRHGGVDTEGLYAPLEIGVPVATTLMGDIVGRLFREFAITLAVAILISAVVSLTLTPMMCARMLSQESLRKQKTELPVPG